MMTTRTDPGFRRSHHAQLEAMRRDWPSFHGLRFGDGTVAWIGEVQPQAQLYTIEVFWNLRILDRPYVVVADPPITPSMGLTYEHIPHLMFNAKEPMRSGLCLFDSDGREWTPADLIAESIILWAAEWLLYYELWHLCGEWLGPGVGHESIGRMRAEEARAVRSMIAQRLDGSST
jgi:hypothetical protein